MPMSPSFRTKKSRAMICGLLIVAFLISFSEMTNAEALSPATIFK